MTAQFDVSNLKSMLSQARTTWSGLNGLSGSAGSSSAYVNSVFSLIDEGEQALEGNDSQKAQAITGIVQNILSMFMSISNESNKAKTEVKQNETSVTTVDSNAEANAKTVEEQVQNITNVVANDTTSISNAISKINELGGENGDGGQIAAAKQELEKQIQIIEENKRIINDGVSNPEAKQQALDNIRGAASVINGLVEQVLSIQEEIEAQNSVVETASGNIEQSLNQSVTVLTNGQQNLQNAVNQEQVQIQVNTKTSIEGSADETAGATLKTMGTTTSWLPFGQSVSSKALQVGMDLMSAGATRISGAASNMANITTALGKMGNNLTQFQNQFNSLGGIAENCSNLIGQYSTSVDGLITATGSWQTVETANLELENAIVETQQKLDGGYNQDTYTFDWSNNSNGSDKVNKGSKEKEAPEKSLDENNSDEKEKLLFNFDTKTFGI